MGQDVDRTTFSRRDRQVYRSKLQRSLDAMAAMLRDGRFVTKVPTSGLEIEFALVDQDASPALVGPQVLDEVEVNEFQSELGRWNIELNLPPRSLPGEEGLHLERHLLDLVASVEAKAQPLGVQLMMIGILPTLERAHFEPEFLTPNPRYDQLNEQMMLARGEPFRLDIDGFGIGDGHPERLTEDFDSIAPEAACTSTQLHLVTEPDEFPAIWNAAQCLAGVQLAIGANSPYLLGKQLWAETRIPVFEQSCDVRSVELLNQGVRPRVWFGEKWITSILELFEENLRYFPALLPICETDEPLDDVRAGLAPGLAELRLHNSTIWRWNRPVYAVVDGEPHLRVENRVLPSGPSAVDTIANAMFFYGLVRVLAAAERPLWGQMSFKAAEDNFVAAARQGMDALLYWPELGWVRPDELVLRKLLPMAADGLDRWGMSAQVAGRYLSVIEQRCLRRRTGASWQVDTVRALTARGLDRPAALRGMLQRYLDGMCANVPVHAWSTPG